MFKTQHLRNKIQVDIILKTIAYYSFYSYVIKFALIICIKYVKVLRIMAICLWFLRCCVLITVFSFIFQLYIFSISISIFLFKLCIFVFLHFCISAIFHFPFLFPFSGDHKTTLTRNIFFRFIFLIPEKVEVLSSCYVVIAVKQRKTSIKPCGSWFRMVIFLRLRSEPLPPLPI